MKKGEKGGERERKKGENQGKWRKLRKHGKKNMRKHALQISMFFPQKEIIMGEKYENVLK